MQKDCGSTITIKVKKFGLGHALDCEGHCLREDDLDPCGSKSCPGTIIRNLIQILKKRIESATYFISHCTSGRI